MKIRLLVLFAVLSSVGVPFAQNNRPKVAIKTFENPANFSRSTIGNGLTDILTTELQNTGKFNVVERTNVDELTKEMDFANTQYAKTSTFAQKGNMLGAQYLLMGKVTNFSYAEHLERQQNINLLGPNTIQTVYKQQADVRIDFRLIDVASGETVISQPGEAHQTNTSQVSEMETWYRCTTSGSITAELSSSLIGRATTTAVKDIVRKLNSLSATVREASQQASVSHSLDQLASAQAPILGDEGGGLWIVGLGSANGIQRGDRLRITHENLVKDKAGHVIYKKPVEIGTMEITDVSMADHAEAKILSGGSGSPQVNDVVRIDVDYARTLRGGAAAVPAPSLPSVSAGGSTSAIDPRAEQHIKRADSYMSDKFWSQALDEYNQAASINAGDARALQGRALTHYMLGDFLEGDEDADKLLQSGSALNIPVAHYHNMGLCTGKLVIQRGRLVYQSDKGDGFDVAAGSLASIAVHRLSKPFMANEKAPDWPVLQIHWRDASGHDKKYEMLLYQFSRQQTLSGKNFASAFPMDDSDLAQMSKLEQSLATLAQKYVK